MSEASRRGVPGKRPGKDHNPKDLMKGTSKTCTKVIKIVNHGG